MPGPEFVDTIDFVIGDAAQDIGWPGLWINAIQLGCPDQGIDDGCRLFKQCHVWQFGSALHGK